MNGAIKKSGVLALRWLLVCTCLGAGVPPGGFTVRAGPVFAPLDIRLPGGLVEFSSPTLADLDGDGRPEVVIGTTRHNGQTGAYDRPGGVAAVRGDGALLWWVELGSPVNSSPAAGDVDGDGRVEVVVGLGGDTTDVRAPGGVAALDGPTGAVRWVFRTQDHNGDGIKDYLMIFPDGSEQRLGTAHRLNRFPIDEAPAIVRFAA